LVLTTAVALADGTGPQAPVASASSSIEGARSAGLVVQRDDGNIVVAFGSKVSHRYGLVAKLLPLLLAHGWGYGEDCFDSAAVGLASVTPTGALDPGFGKNGVTVTPLPPARNQDIAVVTALVRDRQRRLVVVGWRTKSTLLDANVVHITAARYTSRGNLDASFGDQGVLLERRGHDYVTRAQAAAIDEEGRLLVAGYGGGHKKDKYSSDWTNDLVVARFGVDGKLDPHFGDHGFGAVLVKPAPTGETVDPRCVQDPKTCAWLYRDHLQEIERSHLLYRDPTATLALDAGGRILAAGSASDGTIVLARFLPDGAVDATFGSGGTVRFPASADTSISTLLRDSDGRLLLVGSGDDGIVLARSTDAGTPDANFGAGGTRRTGVAKGLVAGSALLATDGALVVAASSETTLALVRLDGDGVPVPGFGSAGVMSRETARLGGPAGLEMGPQGQLTAVARSEDGVALLVAVPPGSTKD
jgi:uncharacterized delta-60 repeat protein